MATNLAARALSPGPVAYGTALLLVAVATVAGLLIEPRWGTEPVVLLFLPAVLGAAVYCGLWPSLGSAAAAALAYNYFFTAPYHTLAIDSPADIMTVLVLFLVAVVTSQLAGSMREQARLAAANAERNATIAGFARQLLACTGEQNTAQVVVRRLARLFECHAALVIGQEHPSVIASEPAAIQLAPNDFAAAGMTLATGQPTGRGVRRADLADWQFRAVEGENGVLASVGLARNDGLPPVSDEHLPLLGNLLDQVALALERARLEQEAREVIALRERDRFRSALLSSIGEDLKPRLNTISLATRSLRRSGAADKSLVASIGAETIKLERYVDNLVDLSPGDEQRPVEFGPVTLDFRRRRVLKDGEPVKLTPKEYALLAELARNAGRVLTHAQLLRSVWGPAQQDHIDYLRVAIRSLRQKLERNPANPDLIINEPAVGYRLASG